MRSNALILLAIASLAAVPLQEAKAAIDLKTAGTYAVLAGTTVTNTGATTLNGDLGLNSGTSITGTGTVTFTAGTIHATDTASGIAKDDLTAAYIVAAGLAPTQTMTVPQLGGLTLTPGVYYLAGQGLLTGTLTLDAQNNPNAEFVFQIGSELIAASGSSVVTIAGGSTPAGSNVFWQVGSSATLNTTTAFQGHILALTSVDVKTGATIINGSAMARIGAVTLQGNTITHSVVPEPATMTLALFGGALSLMKRSRRVAR